MKKVSSKAGKKAISPTGKNKKPVKKNTASQKASAKKITAKKQAVKSKPVKKKTASKTYKTPLASPKKALKKVKTTNSAPAKQMKEAEKKLSNNNNYKLNLPGISMKDKVKPIGQTKITGEVSEKNRYSDDELSEFKFLIIDKLENARKELTNLQTALTHSNEHGTDDTASTFKMLEDGSDTLAKEEAGQLAARQRKFIDQLENALVRIENKTYGVCRVTGKLIPKERLRSVPHTTQSMEAKMQQYRQ